MIRKFIDKVIAAKQCKSNNYRADDGDKLLLISPHMDDDVLGCGGLLALRAKLGKAAPCIVYLTDGTRGNVKLVKDSRLTFVRKQETKNALRVLGITDPALIFMDRPDFAMVPDNDAVKAMVAALINYQPDHIFVNSPWDSHPDHKAACKLLKLVIKDRLMKTLKSTIVLYEIYDPLPDCVSIDITDFIELKHSAFKCHSSQTKLLPYNDYVAGLNVFRGMKIAQLGSKKRVHGEGFMAMSKENFCQLVTKLLG